MVTANDVRLMLGVRDAVVIPFKAVHYDKMDLSEGATLTMSETKDIRLSLQVVEESGMGFTAIYQGKIAAAFWFNEFWPGTAEGSLLADKSILSKPNIFSRSTRRLFARIAPRMGWRRVQITVDSRREDAIAWAKFLGFECEGLLRAYGPGGEDHYMYARVYDVGTV